MARMKLSEAEEMCLLTSRLALFMGFKDTVYPSFDSDTLFLECVFVLFSDYSTRGMSKQYPLTV